MSEHTPGPWVLIDEDLDRSRYVVDTSTPAKAIADCWPDAPVHLDLPHTLEYQANARLIAAAPDMLDALVKIRDWWLENIPVYNEEDEMPADIFDAMVNAIRRAHG